MRQKVALCTTPEELLALAASEGVELTAEQIEMVSGGASWDGGGEPSCYRVDYMQGCNITG